MDTRIAIGGLVFHLEGEHTLPRELVPFAAEGGEVDAVCRARRGVPAPVKPDRLLFDSDGIWCLDGDPDGEVRLVLRDGGPGGEAFHVVELSSDLDTGDVIIDPRHLPADDPAFPLREPMLELWASFLLLRGRGLLVHGCGLLADEGVLAFCGASGAGKSTLAGILHDAEAGPILSDDRLVFRPDGDGTRVFGTPWHGEARFGAPGQGKLRRLLFLEQAPGTSVQPIQPSEAAARLAAVCFVAGWPRSAIQNVLEHASRVVARVPCELLRFTPDPSVLPALDLEPGP